MIDTTSEGPKDSLRRMDTQNQDEEPHPVRKLLQSLPSITAREDLEVQLRKRLVPKVRRTPYGEWIPTSEQQKETSLWDTVFAPRRIPAYALSVLAIAAAGTIAYFSLIRTNVAPIEQPQKQEEVKQETPQQQTSPPQLPAAKPGSRITEDQKQPTLSVPSRESVKDEMKRRGLFKEVGGTGIRSEQPAETSDMPFLRALPDAALQLLHDSIARADSAKRDSILKPLQEDHRKDRDR